MKIASIKFLLALLVLFAFTHAPAQHALIDKQEGVWAGTMYMYGGGQLKDSVQIVLTIARQPTPGQWTWKTEYLSATMPMTKDYVLRVKDRTKNIFVTDEGDGIELTTYLIDKKLYNVFETHQVMLTSTYEFRGNEIVFEVTSGKKEAATHPEITNFAISNLQRAVLKRKKS